MRIIIINGPNLNLLGTRETDIYGDLSFEEYFSHLEDEYPDVQLSHYQSNVEGELINKIQETGFDHDGIILNAGGYTHTSVAIADAIAAVLTPVIEVHISNIFARETERKTSLISSKSSGLISGMGLQGYSLAIRYLKTLKNG